MATGSARGWSRWWWDVTVWGTIVLATLVHGLLYESTEEHTLAVALMGLWVGFSLFQIRRGRHRRREAADSTSPDAAGRQPSSTETSTVNRGGRTALMRPMALVVLAVAVIVILSTGNLTVPVTALGVWVAMELAQWQISKDPPERRPPDPSLHDPTRRN